MDAGRGPRVTDVQKADSIARRQAALLLVAGAVIGALLIFGLERYRVPLREWIAAEPGGSASRLKLLLLLAGGVLAPMLAFSAYLWVLGRKVARAQQFPPPRHRVVRDTPILRGPAAVTRGRVLMGLGLCLGLASVLSWALLWRLLSTVTERRADR